jgi:polyisoprenoid-binding protein YceI
MTLRAGIHELSPQNGSITVRTYREGMAQRVGHDLILEAVEWRASVEVGEDDQPSEIELEVDARSLQVREGLHGLKPLSGKDRTEIRKNIEEKILRGQPISFRSSEVRSTAGKLAVSGELTLAGTANQVGFELETRPDGSVSGTLPVTQSEWGIKPYRGLMGALKVRDDVEVVIDVRLPTG